MTNEQSITLLRRNKQEQIEAFKAVGMVDVDENTRASEFAKRIKWAGGLLDLCLACVRIADGSYHYFTHSEWENLNDANKALYVKRGLRVRAEGHSFVMAALDCQFNSAATMKWGTTTAVPGMSSKTCNAAYMDFDGEGNTSAIVAAATTAGTYPAGEAANDFTAYTAASDGVEDVSDWHLPGLGVWILINKYWNPIQEALNAFWNAGAKLVQDSTYWSSTQCSASEAFTMTSYGYIFPTSKGNSCRVRAVCDEI